MVIFHSYVKLPEGIAKKNGTLIFLGGFWKKHLQIKKNFQETKNLYPWVKLTVFCTQTSILHAEAKWHHCHQYPGFWTAVLLGRHCPHPSKVGKGLCSEYLYYTPGKLVLSHWISVIPIIPVLFSISLSVCNPIQYHHQPPALFSNPRCIRRLHGLGTFHRSRHKIACDDVHDLTASVHLRTCWAPKKRRNIEENWKLYP